MAKKKKSAFRILLDGLLYENPVLILLLGTCPALAVTNSAFNGLGMGLAATFVLIGSNLMISLLRNIIPQKVRIPSFIVIIAGFVTIVEMLMKAFTPELDRSLGIFISLIVVNCIILARAEMFASKNSVLPSFLDAVGMGLGFTLALLLIGSIREILGAGSFFGLAVPVLQKGGYIEPIGIFVQAPGGFFVFGLVIALAQALTRKLSKNESKKQFNAMCGDCTGCGPLTDDIEEAVIDDEAENATTGGDE